jgi:hypothetical protein
VGAGPLTLGQLSVWRDIDTLPRDRWHEPNHASVVPLGRAVPVAAVRGALRSLEQAHESLRTVFDVTEPARPRQLLLEPAAQIDVPVVTVADEDVPDLLARLQSVPFDLRTDRPWRVVALAVPGPAADDVLVDRVVLSQHHIAFDAWSVALFGRQLAELVGAAGVHRLDDGGSLVGIAEEQRSSPVWAKRGEAVERHFRRIYAAPPAQHVETDPAHGVVQVSLTSAALLGAAQRHARVLGVSLGTLVVAAVVDGLRPRTDGPLVVGLMSSNRFGARWQHLLTSMNQWAVIAVPPGEETFDDLARDVQQRSMVAYRLGIYDVDAVRAIGGEVDGVSPSTLPTFTVNAFEVDALPVTDSFDATAQVVREPVFSSVGPRSYLRLIVSPEALCLRLRTNGLPVTAAEELLTHVHSTLLRAASAAPTVEEPARAEHR